MRRGLLAATVMFGILFAAATTRSDDVDSTTPVAPTQATPEPITGTAVQNAPGSETPQRDPFTLYSAGPMSHDKSPKPLWQYADLKPDERAVLDRGRDTTGWAATHDAFARASAQLATRAASDSAARQLGLENVGTIGVVP